MTGASETVVTDDPQFKRFKQGVYDLAGLDLNAHKHGQMHRRLCTLRDRMGVTTWTAMLRRLQESGDALAEFRNFVTINVSELFRNAQKFDQLAQEILPELLANRGALRVWSAGCSYGAEPYSVAMLLDDRLPDRAHEILATDIDKTMLEQAAAGRGFSDSDIRSVPSHLRSKHLHEIEPGEWAVSARLRGRVRFIHHDLLRSVYPPGIDLIVCRNVVIYFTEEAKSRIYRQFFQCLRPGGYLFVGGTEILLGAREIGFETPRISFYRRPVDADPARALR